MSKKQKILIISSIALVLTILLVIIIILIASKNTKTRSMADKYELVDNESVLFGSETVGSSGDFIYFLDYPIKYYGEYDIKNDKMLQLPIKNFIGCLNFYDGDLYAVCINDKEKLTISKIDVNTGNYEEIYVTPPDVDGLYNFGVSKSGLMFFNERRPTSEIEYGKYVENEDGFRINYMLYMYNPETKEKTPLVEGAESYCIRGKRLYFKRVHKTLQEVVYYIDIENPEKVVDTGIVCRNLDAVNSGYTGEFYVDQKGEYIYYSGATNEYRRKNIETGEEETLYTYTDSEGYWCQTFDLGGKQILYIRCVIDSIGGMGTKLFEFDLETKEAKQIWEDSPEEQITYCADFKNNDDYILLWTHPTSKVLAEKAVGHHYYLVYKDGTRKLIFDDNEIWNAATLNRKG